MTTAATLDLTPAKTASHAWAAQPMRDRLARVEAFRKLLVARADDFCRVIAEEVGKTPTECVGSEILPTADACRWLVRRAAKILAPRNVGDTPFWLFGERDVVHRRPRGVVGIIGTWNYPLFLNAGQILHALAAGNAVVWKPSENTPRFAELLRDTLDECGLFPGLFRMLPPDRESGPLLVEAAGLDHLVFTGSARVGRDLAERLGRRLISSTLELSGSDAMFVLADADPVLAAKAAWFGTTLNRGQTCIAVRRVFVHRTLYSTFCDTLTPLIAAAKPCRVVLAAAAKQAEKVVADAIARGGRLLVDASAPPGDERTCLPRVVVDATPEMEACRDALFAPVMAVLPFDEVGDALAMEERCPYALGASIFTPDMKRADEIAARLRPGTVCVNDVIAPTAHPATPFGGRGESGWGVTQGEEGLLEMTIPQVVGKRAGSFRPHYDSADPAKAEAMGGLLRGMLQATHGPTLGSRLSGWWKTIRAMMKGT